MNWYSFLKFAQIWNIESDGSFSDELRKFYELEYKHSMISNHPWKGIEQRKENTLKELENQLWEAGENLREPLLQTFEAWLNNHALMDPGLWAQQRTNEEYEYDYLDRIGEDAIQGILSEYMRYKNEGRGWYNLQKGPNWNKATLELLEEIIENKNNFPSLNPLWQFFKQYQEEYLLNVLEEDGLQEVNRMYGSNFKSEEEVENNMDNIIESTMDIRDIMDINPDLFEMIQNAGVDIKQFIHEVNQNLVFPKWLEYWKSQGIEQTRKNIEIIYEKLKSSNNSISSLKAGINAALHASHQTGEMIEHLEQYAGEYVDAALLRELSEGNSVEQWNEELRKIGVEI